MANTVYDKLLDEDLIMNTGLDSGVSFAAIFATLGQMLENVTSDVLVDMEEYSNNPALSESEMLAFQADMELYKMAVDTVSNTIKTVGDTADVIVQNIK